MSSTTAATTGTTTNGTSESPTKKEEEEEAPLDVEAIRARMQATHDSGVNYTYEWRVQQLMSLRRVIVEHADEWNDSLLQDIGKHEVESLMTETSNSLQELDLALHNLRAWMKPQSLSAPITCFPMFSHVEPRPRSAPACLVIAPFNYPVCLALLPAIGSLAAGNPTIIKPSDVTPHVSALMQRLVHRYCDPGALQVVLGGPETTMALLKHMWGLVLFTGSERVGKIIAAQTAQTLTPTVLELGGKCPAYVDETAPSDLRQVAHRIIWAKTLNAGQTCVAVDTLLVHEAMAPKLLPLLVEALHMQFGADPYKSELGRMVQKSYAQRQVDMIQQVEQYIQDAPDYCEILVGGSADCRVEECYIRPTLIVNPPPGCRMLQEEIFGPILPIVIVKNRESAIDYMKTRMGGAPLSLYMFTTSRSIFADVRRRVPAGIAFRNDCLIHMASPHFPFGGLGASGFGSYHGKHSFQTFSHMQTVFYRPCVPGADMGWMRFHPFAGWKRRIILQVSALTQVPSHFVAENSLPLVGTVVLAMGVMVARQEPEVWHSFKDYVASMLETWAQSLRR
jgi:acyl-CoA reductase-like NAD-dependent aldehyde dehydrogenase